MKQKLGKRRRRALVRLRHALAAEKFTRWLQRSGVKAPFKPHVGVTARLWHSWHALGCP